MAGLDGTITVSNSQYRPCVVADKKALFHNWVHREKAFLKIKAFVSDEIAKDIKNRFEKSGICTPQSDIVKISETYAIIEYEDGTIGKVLPNDIRFVDNLFAEYNFGGADNDK